MPFEVPSPMVETFTPTRYPSVDWSRKAEVRECWLPNEKPVGWLVIQDDANLSWLSSVSASRPAAYAVREIIQDTLRDSIENRLTAREAWDRCMTAAMWRNPEYMEMAELAKRLQEEWS